MKCPKCNSEHTTIQPKEVKSDLTLGLCLLFGGLGLMFFGIGAIFGVVLGLVLGLILKSALPVRYESILVCQSCGHSAKIKDIPNSELLHTSDEKISDDINFIIVRENLSLGSAVVFQIKIDNETVYDLANGQTIKAKLSEGVHRIAYSQKNGMGKKNRYGEFEASIGETTKVVRFTLTQNGVTIVQN